MINVNATISGHQLSLVQAYYATQYTLPTGSIEVDQIHFDSITGSEWTSATTKKVQFWQDPGAIYESAISSNNAVIPPEVLAKPGLLHIAAYGVDSNGKRISTNECMLLIDQGSFTEAGAPAPNPSIFEQAVATAVAAALAGAIAQSGHYTKPPNGIPETDLDSATRLKLARGANAQPMLTAGQGINIDSNNVISVTGSGGTLPSISVVTLTDENGTLTSDTPVASIILAASRGTLVFVKFFTTIEGSGHVEGMLFRSTYFDQSTNTLYFSGDKKRLIMRPQSNPVWKIEDALDSAPTTGSANAVTSGGVAEALAAMGNADVNFSELAVPSINLFDKTKAQTGTLLNTSGATQTNASYWTSDYIPVTPGEDYVFYTASSGMPILQRAAFYDADKTLIGETINKIQDSSGHYNLDGYYYSHTAPANAAYLRLCGGNALLDYTVVKRGTSPTYYDECKHYPLNEFRLTDVEDILLGGTKRMWESGGIDSTGTLIVNNKRARFARAMSFPFTVTLASGYILASAAFYNRSTGALEKAETYTAAQAVTTFKSDGTYAVKLAVRATPTEVAIIPGDDIIASATGLAEYVLGLSASINNVAPGYYTLSTLPPAASNKFALTPLPTGLLWSDGHCWRRADNNNVALAGNSYITIDTNGNRIAGYNEDQDSVVWSMTKLLTAVVVVETLGDQELSVTQDRYTVNTTDAGTSEEAVGTETSGSLYYGDSVCPEDLLKASLIFSDNIATDCLARNVGIALAQADGITNPTDAQANAYFSAAMSAKAAALGLTRTYYFSNHHGQMRSTASDMAKLIKYIYTTIGNSETALALAHIRNIWGQASYTIEVYNEASDTWRQVTNESTTSAAVRELLPEFVGGKTGSDNSKGAYGIVWEAKDNSAKYISVFLDAPLTGRFHNMRSIIDEVYGIHARGLTESPSQPEANIATATYGVTAYTRVREELLAGNLVVTRTADDIYLANATSYGLVGVYDTIVFYSVGSDKKIELSYASGWGTPTASPAASPAVETITVATNGAVTQELQPNKIYIFTGDLTSLTLTLGIPIPGIASVYRAVFSNGSTPVNLNLPNTVKTGGFAAEANKFTLIEILYTGIGDTPFVLEGRNI